MGTSPLTPESAKKLRDVPPTETEVRDTFQYVEKPELFTTLTSSQKEAFLKIAHETVTKILVGGIELKKSDEILRLNLKQSSVMDEKDINMILKGLEGKWIDLVVDIYCIRVASKDEHVDNYLKWGLQLTRSLDAMIKGGGKKLQGQHEWEAISVKEGLKIVQDKIRDVEREMKELRRRGLRMRELT
ncbi:hypothetical protein EJ08DRAFT_721853 [Tothia fuscella]|uniref:Uncharacterized protein n=1 Tax=Tothia fuscella TaxID=1048955 RepID=A0A9P4TVL3_9PEZI|nr:hypothetical protein EJ08DRAFT_721853 [Tothia fuscella]